MLAQSKKVPTISILYVVSMATPKAEVARSNRVGSAKDFKGLVQRLAPFCCPKCLAQSKKASIPKHSASKGLSVGQILLDHALLAHIQRRVPNTGDARQAPITPIETSSRLMRAHDSTTEMSASGRSARQGADIMGTSERGGQHDELRGLCQ